MTLSPLRWPLLLTLWALLSAVALWMRPLLPIDETRYAAVAWEMWQRGDWLVPHINGEPYSHKPPLLFWLIGLGWALLGSGDWVPRLVAALIGLADLLLFGLLARRLWPADAAAARLAPWVFYGCLAIALFATTLMFDLLMTACVLLGLLGLLRAWRGGGRLGWGLYALGIGLGLLSKGPPVLLALLPVALLAPWWMGERWPGGWARWYRNAGLALLLGCALALCWVIPAVLHGGEEYRQMILWEQTAGRVVQSFAHARPWWWYLPVLPLLLLPWSLWLPLWRNLAALRDGFGVGERFCLAWFLPGLLAFSAVSGKQVHYLLPLLPAVLLLVARALAARPPAEPSGRGAVALVLAPFVVFGVLLSFAPLLAEPLGWPHWLAELSPLWGLVLVVGVLPWTRLLRRTGADYWLVALSAVFLVLLHVGVLRSAAPLFGVEPLGELLAALQAEGRPVILAAQYRDQYPFARRMAAPLSVLAEGGELAWAQAHPQGVLLTEHKRLDADQHAAALLALPYRRGEAVLWSAQTLLAHPHYLENLEQRQP